MFPGGKGSQCIGLTTYHLHVPIVLKSGSLNLLEPSGPVKACNGIALPLPRRGQPSTTQNVETVAELKVLVAGDSQMP